jgi:hypothetical protein
MNQNSRRVTKRIGVKPFYIQGGNTMRKSWLTLLASQSGKGTPSSGSTPTSAAAWSCDQDGTQWGYSKNKGTDMPEQQDKSWHDSGTFADNHKKAWLFHDWTSGVMMKQIQAEGGE